MACTGTSTHMSNLCTDYKQCVKISKRKYHTDNSTVLICLDDMQHHHVRWCAFSNGTCVSSIIYVFDSIFILYAIVGCVLNPVWHIMQIINNTIAWPLWHQVIYFITLSPQIQGILQYAGACVDLLDEQGASVILALEEGWDFTSQVYFTPQWLL